MGHLWRPEGARKEKWIKHLVVAQKWLLARQEEGALCAVDANNIAWRVLESRRWGYLYYQRGSEAPVVDTHGLLLHVCLPTAEVKAITARRSYVFSPPPRASEADEPAKMKLGKELGRGAFAAVLHASVEGHPFALKRSLRARPSWAETILRDEHFLRALAGHQGVLPVIHSYRDSAKRRCLLLPIALGDLHSLRPLDLPAFEFVASQLGEALSHIHGRGVVHLDLKPQNVLVFDKQHVCIADFGCALRAGHPLDDEKLYEVTRPFRAPELLFAGNRNAYPAIDLWSLGALLWDVFPSEPGHPLVGASNSVEQAVFVLALVGFGDEAAEAWGLPASLARSPLPPFDDAAPAELRDFVCPLLSQQPRKRSLRHLIGRCGRDCFGGTPAKVQECRQSCEEVHEIEEHGDAGAVARLSKGAIVYHTLQ